MLSGPGILQDADLKAVLGFLDVKKKAICFFETKPDHLLGCECTQNRQRKCQGFLG